MKIWWNVLVLVPLAWGSDAKWKLVGSDMVLSAGAMNAKVIPQVGRLKEFSWGSVAILERNNEGSMFYPAPQSVYAASWPPPVGFAYQDKDQVAPPNFPFLLSSDSTVLTARPMAGGKGTALLPSRIYSYEADKKAFTTQYGIKNTGTTNASVAPWEISRIPVASAVFFPMGDKISFSTTWTPIPTFRDDSLVWVKKSGDGQKLFRDGKEGWLAALIDTVLFIKQFPDVPPSQFAPGETEIELYTGTEGFEMEEQGPYTVLKPGDSLTWTVKWYIKAVPKSIATAGNHALVDSVRSVLKSAAMTSIRRVPRALLPAGARPLVDVRGRLLSKSDRALRAGSISVLPMP
jgi:hypothetical protein